ncbi:hypothetical protein NDU88_007607 [Pleurodeles waltl]|uniref:Uncharacterized protein n=1 Tax=Pleurodeles waltl TaxID=8319 RepID=A0AAV7N6U0_PLEWA|nr:hypothetical protein NDU88_007607 [Pleurodeles waltl]
MAAQQTPSSPVLGEPRPLDAIDRILQEITAVRRRLEVMDLKITDLPAASASIRTDIACFGEMVADLDQRLTNVEDHIEMLPEHNAELQTLQETLTDLEDQSHRDKVSFFGMPGKKGRYRYQSIPSKSVTRAHRTDLLAATRVPESTQGQPSSQYILRAALPDHCVFPPTRAGPAGSSEGTVPVSFPAGGSGG